VDFEKIKEAVKNIRFGALRLDNDTKFEAVIIKEEMDKLIALLESFFGPPAFPSKNRLPLETHETINALGGIMAGQTLYYSNQGNYNIFVMLWPWQDGQHTTVKIIKIGKIS
jgi:hypothetical protein